MKNNQYSIIIYYNIVFVIEMASKSQKKKITFFHNILKEDEKIVNSYNKRGYYYEVIVKEPTFWDKIKKYNNNKPYYINKLDQLTYKLCPACKPDDFEDYLMKHETPGYQERCVLDCICGREATLDNILHGCTHCTCIDESTRNKLYISKENKLKKDFLLNKSFIQYDF